jgi:carboxymethylenebutenolidase
MSDSKTKFPPAVMSLFDKYVHGVISRREFIDRASGIAVAGLTGAALLDALNPKFAEAQQVSPTDARLKTESVEIAAPGYGKARGYLVQPAKAQGKLPVVMVVHENRGLNPHIEDVTRRIALENFVAFAPDALFPLGGYPGDEDKAREAFAKLDSGKSLQDFLAAASWLKARADGNGKLGIVGFCWGGGMVHKLATQLPGLDAAVPFYGPAPAPELAAQVKAPMLVHLAATDSFVNPSWERYEPALKAAGVKFTAYQYPGTQHGFNNDTTPRYDAAAAKLAWDRTLAFFKANL